MQAIPRRSSCPSCRAVFRRQLSHCPIDGSSLQTLPTDPLLGSVISGRYHIEAVNGDTRTTRVYRAVDLETGWQLAVRMLLGEYASIPKRCLRFAREARLGAMFDHANVLSVLDSGYTATGLPFIVTEYVDARTLEAVIRLEAPFSGQRARRLIIGVCRGLLHIHERGVIHRNLTAGNVLLASVDEREVPRITGFRLAIRTRGPRSNTGDFVERPDKVLGSAAYMAPELVAQQPVDLRSDLFSLGVMLYRMLCGAFPFDGPPLAVALHNDMDAPPPISVRVPGFRANDVLEGISLRLMSRDPDQRYATAREVLAALEDMWE